MYKTELFSIHQQRTSKILNWKHIIIYFSTQKIKYLHINKIFTRYLWGKLQTDENYQRRTK